MTYIHNNGIKVVKPLTIGLLLNICLALSLQAQDNVDVAKMVGFACYYEGKPSKPVAKVSKLLSTKRYRKLATLLQSKNPAEVYLAAISLERLETKGRYTLSKPERQLISSARSSDRLVSVCSGCTFFDQWPLKHMFADDRKSFAEQWLTRYVD
jgi:hypothetical protein